MAGGASQRPTRPTMDHEIPTEHITVISAAWTALTSDDSVRFQASVADAIYTQNYGKEERTTDVFGVFQEFQLAETLAAITMVIRRLEVSQRIPVTLVQRVALVNARVYGYDAPKYSALGNGLVTAIGDRFSREHNVMYQGVVTYFIARVLETMMALGADDVVELEPKPYVSLLASPASLVSERNNSMSSQFSELSLVESTTTVATEAMDAEPPKKRRALSESPKEKKHAGKVVTNESMKKTICEPNELQHTEFGDDSYDLINCFDIHEAAPVTPPKAVRMRKPSLTRMRTNDSVRSRKKNLVEPYSCVIV
ncbi:hypothetical protein DICA4_E09868 [Diutina catenulata]